VLVIPVVEQAPTGVSTAGATTTLSTVTPQNYTTYLLWASVSSGAAFTDTATVTAYGMTWTKIAGFINGNDYHVAFYAYGAPTNPGIAATGSLTFSRTPTSGRYGILSVPFSQKNDGTDPIYASGSTNGTNTGGSISWSPSADWSVAEQLSVSMWAHAAAEATTHDTTGATWTELVDTSTVKSMEVQYLQFTADGTHTATWTSSVFYSGWVVQFKNPALTAAKKNDTRILATKTAVVPELDDQDVWAMVT